MSDLPAPLLPSAPNLPPKGGAGPPAASPSLGLLFACWAIGGCFGIVVATLAAFVWRKGLKAVLTFSQGSVVSLGIVAFVDLVYFSIKIPQLAGVGDCGVLEAFSVLTYLGSHGVQYVFFILRYVEVYGRRWTFVLPAVVLVGIFLTSIPVSISSNRTIHDGELCRVEHPPVSAYLPAAIDFVLVVYLITLFVEPLFRESLMQGPVRSDDFGQLSRLCRCLRQRKVAAMDDSGAETGDDAQEESGRGKQHGGKVRLAVASSPETIRTQPRPSNYLSVVSTNSARPTSAAHVTGTANQYTTARSFHVTTPGEAVHRRRRRLAIVLLATTTTGLLSTAFFHASLTTPVGEWAPLVSSLDLAVNFVTCVLPYFLVAGQGVDERGGEVREAGEWKNAPAARVSPEAIRAWEDREVGAVRTVVASRSSMTQVGSTVSVAVAPRVALMQAETAVPASENVAEAAAEVEPQKVIVLDEADGGVEMEALPPPPVTLRNLASTGDAERDSATSGAFLTEHSQASSSTGDKASSNAWHTFEAPKSGKPVPPPLIAEQRDIIDKVAQSVAKSDVAFLYHMMQKESARPDTKCRFLWPGAAGHDYFAYKVWALRNPAAAAEMERGSVPPPPLPSQASQAPLSSVRQPSPVPASSLSPLGVAIVEGLTPVTGEKSAKDFAQVIETLRRECSQSTIQTGKLWVFENCTTPAAIQKLAIALNVTAINAAATFESRLHLLYLLNDVFYHAHRRNQRWMLDAYLPQLVPLLSVTYHTPGIDAAKKEKVEKVLKIWASKGIFDEATVKNFRTGMTLPRLPGIPGIPVPSVEEPKPPGSVNHPLPVKPSSIPPSPTPPTQAPPRPPFVGGFPPMVVRPGGPVPPPMMRSPLGGPPMMAPGPAALRPPLPSGPPGVQMQPPPGMGPIRMPGMVPGPPGGGMLQFPPGMLAPPGTVPMPIRAPVGMPGGMAGGNFQTAFGPAPPPAPEKKYYQLPAGLMVPLVKQSEKHYAPIDADKIKALPPLPSPVPDDLQEALDDFYAGLEEQRMVIAQNSLAAEEEAAAPVDEANDGVVPKKDGVLGTIDRNGWQVGYLDDWLRQRRRALAMGRSRVPYDDEDGGRGERKKSSRRQRRSRSSESSESSSSDSESSNAKKRSRRKHRRSEPAEPSEGDQRSSKKKGKRRGKSRSSSSSSSSASDSEDSRDRRRSRSGTARSLNSKAGGSSARRRSASPVSRTGFGGAGQISHGGMGQPPAFVPALGANPPDELFDAYRQARSSMFQKEVAGGLRRQEGPACYRCGRAKLERKTGPPPSGQEQQAQQRTSALPPLGRTPPEVGKPLHRGSLGGSDDASSLPLPPDPGAGSLASGLSSGSRTQPPSQQPQGTRGNRMSLTPGGGPAGGGGGGGGGGLLPPGGGGGGGVSPGGGGGGGLSPGGLSPSSAMGGGGGLQPPRGGGGPGGFSPGVSSSGLSVPGSVGGGGLAPKGSHDRRKSFMGSTFFAPHSDAGDSYRDRRETEGSIMVSDSKKSSAMDMTRLWGFGGRDRRRTSNIESNTSSRNKRKEVLPKSTFQKIERPPVTMYQRIVYALDILIPPEDAEDIEVPHGHFLQKVILSNGKWRWRVTKDGNHMLPEYLASADDRLTTFRVYKEKDRLVPLFDPNGRFIRRWDALTLILLIFTATVTPFETADTNTGRYVSDPRFIAMNYIRTWFCLDFLSVLPLELLSFSSQQGSGSYTYTYINATDTPMYSYSHTTAESTSMFMEPTATMANTATNTVYPTLTSMLATPTDAINATAKAAMKTKTAYSDLKLVRFMRLMRLLKLLRVLRASRKLRQWQAMINIRYATLQVIQYSIFTILMIHWMACGFRLAADKNDPNDPKGWTEHYAEDTNRTVGNVTIWEMYMVSMYWSATTVSLIGPNMPSVQPANVREFGYELFAGFVSYMNAVYFIAIISDVLATSSKVSRQNDLQVDKYMEMFDKLSLDSKLRIKVHNYLSEKFALDESSSFTKLLQRLPPTLHGFISMEIFLDFVDQVPYLAPFIDREPNLIQELCRVVEINSFPPNSHIFTEGGMILGRSVLREFIKPTECRALTTTTVHMLRRKNLIESLEKYPKIYYYAKRWTAWAALRSYILTYSHLYYTAARRGGKMNPPILTKRPFLQDSEYDDLDYIVVQHMNDNGF
ncbi:hypothetical protein HDU96_003819 [Phlyctochytrium bullatum]|nr:hypothetical protein HDU96_003819 [Phlyctochytrium bullatum]